MKKNMMLQVGMLWGLLALFAPSDGWCDPAISGVSDNTLTHDETITISGSGFGMKSPAEPLVWDNCSHGQPLSARWSGGWPTDPSYAPNYRTVQRGQPLPHSHTTRYLSMCNFQNGGADNGWNGIFWKNITFSDPTHVFLSYRMRCDSSFNSGDNWKFFDYSCGGTPYTMDRPDWNNWYMERSGGLPTSGSTITMNVNDDGASLRPWLNIENVWWADRYPYVDFTTPRGNWIQMETMMKLIAENDGIIRWWVNGKQTFDYSPTNPKWGYLDHWTDRYTGTARNIGLGGYVRTKNTDDWWYFTDIYMDTTLARACIGNAATYSACTVREMLIPNAWSTSSITAIVNQGTFANGATAYIYVVDAEGTVNANGYPVTFGGSSTNHAPVAESQSVTVTENTSKAILLVGSDADADMLSYTVTANPAHGTLSGTAPSVTYAPAANYSGADSFKFKVNDGKADSAVASVSITVTAVNHKPVANAQNVTTAQDTAKAITLAGSDSDGDALTYTITTNPAHGTLTGSGASRTYTPASGYSGSDSFAFKVNDGKIDSDVATVSITVTAVVNHAPVATAQSVTTNEDTAKAITLTATDSDGDALTFGIMSQPSHGALGGTLPNLTYTPTANYNGADSFTFRATDSKGVVSNTATISITVTAVNDAPVADNQSVTTAEDTAKAITLTSSDVEGSARTYAIVANPSHGTVSLSGATATYTPAANYNGSDSFTFRANDGALNSNTATVSITVSAVNDAPAVSISSPASGATFTAPAAITINANASDPDGAADISKVEFFQGTTKLGEDTSSPYNFTWNNVAAGNYSLTAKVTDKGGATKTSAAVTVTVNAVTEVVLDNTAAGTSKSAGWYNSTYYPGFYGSDYLYSDNASGKWFQWQTTTLTPGTYAVYGWWTAVKGRPTDASYQITHQNGNASVTANQELNGGKWNLLGTYTFGSTATIRLNSGATGVEGTCADAVRLVRTTDNSAPVAAAQSVTTNEDTAKTITLSATDANGDALTYAIVANPAHGTLTGTGANRTYTPVANYSGKDSFTFKANDGKVDSAVATVSITVNTTAVDLALDNTATGTSKSAGWYNSTYYPGFYGSDYLYSDNASGKWFQWQATSLKPGTYAVYGWWTAVKGRPTDASYQITHQNGTASVAANQELNGGKWNLLGTYTFGSTATIRLNSGATGVEGTCADAVRIVRTATINP